MNSKPLATDKTAPQTLLVNCILSPVAGPQVFENIQVPLASGEQAVRFFFEGWSNAKGLTLAKVSMCVYTDGNPDFAPNARALKWYNDCSGKMYFNQDKL